MLFGKSLTRSWLTSWVAALYIFLYAPIIVLVLYSFNKGGFPDAWRGFSLDWYYDLFHSVEIWRACKYSLFVAIVSAALSVLLSICLVYGVRFYNRSIVSLFYSTALVPDIVLAVGLLSLFAYFWIPLGLTTLIAGHTILGLGFTVPVIKTRYDELDASLIEASLDLGATSKYTFFHIIIPFLYPAILVAYLLAFIISLDDFLIAFFCAGSSVQTLSLYIFSMIHSGICPTVNALSTIMLLMSGIAVVVSMRYSIIMQKR